MGWWVSCVSSTKSAMVSCRLLALRRLASSSATNPRRGPRYWRMAPVGQSHLAVAQEWRREERPAARCLRQQLGEHANAASLLHGQPGDVAIRGTTASSARRTNSPRPWIEGQ